MFKLIKTIFICALLMPYSAFANDAADIMACGMSSRCAETIANLELDNATLSNNTYLKASNAAGTAEISVLKVDATDDTVLNADTGDELKLAVAGTAEATLSATALTLTAGTALNGGAGSWGWVLLNTTDNVACSTSCGISACIFGFDAAAATLAGILACSDATADLCFCTGAAS